jgi:hypothetical protein
MQDGPSSIQSSFRLRITLGPAGARAKTGGWLR